LFEDRRFIYASRSAAHQCEPRFERQYDIVIMEFLAPRIDQQTFEREIELGF